MKKVFMLFVVFIAILILVACGNSNTNGNNSQKENDTNSDDDVIELRMAWWGGQERHDLTLEIIELYEDRNPHIKITPEYSGFDGYFDKLTTQFAAKNAPDIIQYGGNLNDYVYRDVVLPLDEFVGDQIDITKHNEDMIDTAIFNDEFYGVTLGVNARGILLNKTLFEEADIPLPDREWTWNDFIDIGIEITDSLDGVHGTDIFNRTGFVAFVNQEGKIFNDNGLPGFDKKDVEKWFKLWNEMIDTGSIVPAEVAATASSSTESSLIVTRKSAMQFVPSNQFIALNNATQDELILHIFPYNDLGSNGVGLRPSMYMAGYSETEYPEEVAKFLDFIVNDEEATQILGNERGAPVNSDVRENLMDTSEENDRAVFEYIDWVSETSDSPSEATLPGYNESEALYQTTIENLTFGIMTVEEATESYWDGLLTILEKNQEE